MPRRHGLVVLSGLLAAVGSACGQAKTWDGGAGSSDWFEDDNWDPDGVPGSSDAVLVQGAVVFAQVADINVRSMLVDDGLILDSRSLYIAEPSQITNFTLQGCCTRTLSTMSTLSIRGLSSFTKGTKFIGAGSTTIDGTAVALDWFNPDAHVVTIAGELYASGNVDPRNGGSVQVTGKLELLPGGDINRASGGFVKLWGGGELGFGATASNEQATMGGVLESVGGKIYSRTGIFDLRGQYPLSFSTIEPTDGGQVWLTGSWPNEIEGVSFAGNGVVELSNANNTYKGALGANMQSPGTLRLKSTVRLDGLLNNTGQSEFSSATLESPGGEGEVGTSGRLTVIAASVSRVPITVFGGVFKVFETSLTAGADITNSADGTVLLAGENAGARISRPSNGQVGSVFNHGTINASAGIDDCLDLTHEIQVPLELRPGSTVAVDDVTLRLHGGGSWTGGTIRVHGSFCESKIDVGGFDVTHFIAGDVRAVADAFGDITIGGNGHTLNVIGTLRTAADHFGSVYLNGKIIGPGEIVNEQGQLSLAAGCDIGTTIVNNAELSLVGSGVLVRGGIRNEGLVTQRFGGFRFEGGVATNEGLWEISGPFNQDVGSGGMLVNNANYHLLPGNDPGYTHSVRVRFDNKGSVLAQDAHAVFQDVAQIVNGELTGGVWEAAGAGSITFPGTIRAIKGNGTRVRGDGDTQPGSKDVEEITEGGELEATGDLDLENPLRITDGTFTILGGETTVPKIDVEGSGKLGVCDGAKVKSPGDLDLHSVAADLPGVICQSLLPAPATIEAPNVLSHGRLIPGAEGRAGQFDFVGNLTQYGDAQILIDVGGNGNTDAITVTGAATIDGTLRVALIDEFAPEGGESFTLISAAGGVFGQFATLDLPELSGELEWEVVYGAGTVELLVAGGGCVADWNGDGNVNTQDFLAYLNAWSAGDPTADLNGDGVVNTQDFLAYLNLWVAGC